MKNKKMFRTVICLVLLLTTALSLSVIPAMAENGKNEKSGKKNASLRRKQYIS